MLMNASGGPSSLQTRLSDAVAAFNGALTAVGNNVVAGQIPDVLRNHAFAMGVWEFLCDFPKLQQFKTDERRDRAKDAAAALKAVANRTWGAVEDPAGPSTIGFWGSENRVVSRLHPVPAPQFQWSNAGQNGPEFANPNAPPIQPQDTVPIAPRNLTAVASATGNIQLGWFPPVNAQYFTIYRSTTSGAELAGGVYATTTSYSFTDNLVTNLQAYYYVVTATNIMGVSPVSNEATATAGVPLPTTNFN